MNLLVDLAYACIDPRVDRRWPCRRGTTSPPRGRLATAHASWSTRRCAVSTDERWRLRDDASTAFVHWYALGVNATLTSDHSARAVRFSASLNARDLGGLPVDGGGVTRHGIAIRSDALLRCSREDEAYLASVPVTTVIDLRQPFERERDRSALVSNGLYSVHEIELFQTLYDTGWTPLDEWDLREIYLASLDHAGSAFVRAVLTLSASRGATLFHCTAGKDRTGLLAALVLESVGVPRTVVLEDYALTHERIGPVRERLLDDARARGIDPAEFARLLGADAEVLEDALEHVDRRFGGAATFLLTHGLPETTMSRLRARLVGP